MNTAIITREDFMTDIAKHTLAISSIRDSLEVLYTEYAEIVTEMLPLYKASPDLLEVATLLHKACGVQANLNSTATVAERSKFIDAIFDICNNKAWPAIAKAKGK